jgi:hypothetical protein
VSHYHPDDEHLQAADTHAAAPDARHHHAANTSDEHRHEHAAREVLS